MNLIKKAWTGLKSVAAAGVMAVASAVAIVPTVAQAAPPDFSALVAEADFSTATTAVLAVAAVLATVYVGIKGSRIVLSFLRS